MSKTMPDFMKTPEFDKYLIFEESRLADDAPDWLKKAFQKWLDDGQKAAEAAEKGAPD